MTRPKVESLVRKEVERFGLALETLEWPSRDELSIVVTVPGCGLFVGWRLDGEAAYSAGPALGSLVRFELQRLRESLFATWHFDSLRKIDPDLVWIDRGRRCPVHPSNVIHALNGGARTYSCAGPDGGDRAHRMPRRCARTTAGAVMIDISSCPNEEHPADCDCGGVLP